jgi:hypothetical protein
MRSGPRSPDRLAAKPVLHNTANAAGDRVDARFVRQKHALKKKMQVQ